MTRRMVCNICISIGGTDYINERAAQVHAMNDIVGSGKEIIAMALCICVFTFTLEALTAGFYFRDDRQQRTTMMEEDATIRFDPTKSIRNDNIRNSIIHKHRIKSRFDPPPHISK